MANRINKRGHMLPLVTAATFLLGTASLADAQTTKATPAATAAKADGSLHESHDAWCSTKLDGGTVYNERGSAVGTIDDMLLDFTGHVSNVVLSVNGFPGIDPKYVEMPFSKLNVESSLNNVRNHDYSVVLPRATKDLLKSMTAFSY